MKLATFCLLLCATSTGAFAQTFFTTPTARYITPGSRGSAGTEFSHWDIFYSPFGDPLVPGSGLNFPDFAAPNGVGDVASAFGITPPANSSPADPFAFWNPANPTIRQTGTDSAFIIGAGAAGNIYSFAAPLVFELADTTPFTLGSVTFQWQTDGALIDLSAVRLVAGGVQYAPSNVVTEYRSSSAPQGGVTNRVGLQWNLTGLGITSYRILFSAPTSSNSFQEAMLDTAAAYSEIVPSARTRTSATGLWSQAAAWAPATAPVTGGNITIASGTSLTVDGGQREIGELLWTAPNSYTIDATGGGSLKINTGIRAAASSGLTFAINAPVSLGSLNLTSIGTGTTVALNGGLSGSAGLSLQGGGRMVLGGTSTHSGPISLAQESTLLVHGSLSAGTLNVGSGRLGGNGTINRSIALANGGTLAPGASVGTLTTGPQTWAGGGRLELQFSAANGVAGTAWDSLAVNGQLNITATSAGRFTLALQTLSSNAPGPLADFNMMTGYSWRFATASGGIASFAADEFTVDTSGFLNPLFGSFSVERQASDLFLRYTPVPEPTPAVMAILGLAGFAIWRNRRVIAGRYTDSPD